MITLCAHCGSAIRYDGTWKHTEATLRHEPQIPQFWLDSGEVAHIVLRVELECLWNDLEQDRTYAYDQTTHWSMACESRVTRIRAVSAIVGPVDWNAIPLSFLLSIDGYEGWGYRETAARENLPITYPDPVEEKQLVDMYRIELAAVTE